MLSIICGQFEYFYRFLLELSEVPFLKEKGHSDNSKRKNLSKFYAFNSCVFTQFLRLFILFEEFEFTNFK